MPFDTKDVPKICFTSDYGNRSLNGGAEFHSGIDLAPDGYEQVSDALNVNILAAEAGTVYRIQDDGSDSYGYHIFLQHDDGMFTLYGHMSRNTATVKQGDKVKRGQVIGKVGNTGITSGATGIHLHFGVYTTTNFNGHESTIDPKTVFSPKLAGRVKTFLT
jgi:murein DD-endopeptidase MepM/ murein hydrolase activator NlpD